MIDFGLVMACKGRTGLVGGIGVSELKIPFPSGHFRQDNRIDQVIIDLSEELKILKYRILIDRYIKDK